MSKPKRLEISLKCTYDCLRQDPYPEHHDLRILIFLSVQLGAKSTAVLAMSCQIGNIDFPHNQQKSESSQRAR
jgi:hypothetical protein